MVKRAQHMHTVPGSYLRAFADITARRRNPHLWQFDRQTELHKPISIRDASVRRNIYTLRTQNGTPDTTIETLLDSNIESPFAKVVRLLGCGQTPEYWQWRSVSRMVAVQLARTPRTFQALRDDGIRQGVEVGPNGPQLAMVHIAPFLEKWICGMVWILCRNKSTFPLVTSDNPVVMWADHGGGAELGVGFENPALRILFPLTPRICLVAAQTDASLKSVLDDVPGSNPRFTDFHPLRIDSGLLGIEMAVRMNQLTVSYAERYVYANSSQENVLLFIRETFFGLRGPVRRSDRRPIGSATDMESSIILDH